METEGESSEQVPFVYKILKSVRPAGLGPLSQCFTDFGIFMNTLSIFAISLDCIYCYLFSTF